MSSMPSLTNDLAMVWIWHISECWLSIKSTAYYKMNYNFAATITIDLINEL
jgi:hypothetical protein